MPNFRNTIAKHIATIAGLGRKTKFPGTLASLVSLIFCFLSYYFLGKTIYAILFFIFLFLGLWAIHEIQKVAEQQDYPSIVIDEWIGMWLASLFLFELDLPYAFVTVLGIALLGFVIFRIIDIFKFIPPIGIIDKKEEQNAVTIILDDVIAGVYTYAIMMFLFGFYNLNSIHLTLLILLPAMIANATPVVLRGIKKFGQPINRELFGQNKTWRGFIGGILFGTLTYWILVRNVLIGANINSIIAVGFLFSFGALFGDLIKSYLKRKNNIKDGESWILWDQIDYCIGAIILTYPIYHYPFGQMILMLIMSGIMSTLSHRFAYSMKMINTKW